MLSKDFQYIIESKGEVKDRKHVALIALKNIENDTHIIGEHNGDI